MITKRGLFFLVILLVITSLSFSCSTTDVPDSESGIENNVASGLDETPTQAIGNDITNIALSVTPSATHQLSPSRTPTQSFLPGPTLTSTPVPEATQTVEVSFSHPSGYIVFQSRRADTNGDRTINVDDGIHIYVLTLGSNEIVQLTEGDQKDTHPIFSPDASKIAFTSNRNNDFKQLYVMNRDGTNIIQLTESSGHKLCPQWSPDGKHIAFIVKSDAEDKNGNDIELLDIEANSFRTLAQLPQGPIDCASWSSDGAYLAIGYKQDNKSHIAILVIQTGEMIEIDLEDKRYDEPQFLPRNDELFLSVIQTPGEFSSSSLIVLRLDEAFLSRRQAPIVTIEDMFGRYSWANNAQWLISTYGFGQKEISSDVFSGYEIIAVPVDFPSILTSENGPFNLFIFEKSEMLTENDFYDDYPDWSP